MYETYGENTASTSSSKESVLHLSGDKGGC